MVIIAPAIPHSAAANVREHGDCDKCEPHELLYQHVLLLAAQIDGVAEERFRVQGRAIAEILFRVKSD
jgi:hypothetical protein